MLLKSILNGIRQYFFGFVYRWRHSLVTHEMNYVVINIQWNDPKRSVQLSIMERNSDAKGFVHIYAGLSQFKIVC